VSVEANLASVRDRIERAGRNPGEVDIVAVTKGFGPAVVREALHAGLRLFGENRVQEGIAKMHEVGEAEWHLIGHLQTNKVAAAVAHFAMIQTVDSVRLAEAIAAEDDEIPVLVEVNVAREPQKTGVDPAEAAEVIERVGRLLNLEGLMAMGPSEGDPTHAFKELRHLRDDAQERLGKRLPILSMGMSADFEAAVKAGSTMVRLGQALFGPRPAQQ
jgi:pyridoxal phosphate enzyme (YggS family)